MTVLYELAIDTGMSVKDAQRIVLTAPARYKKYPISKRNGGQRIIAQPSRELKILQRWAIDRYLKKLPIHSNALAYVKDKNIYHNATAHARNSIIQKFDFRNFFNSIIPKDLAKLLRRNKEFNLTSQDLTVLCYILFWGDGSIKPTCLSVGAPSSPMVSNIVMYDLDENFSKQAARLGLSYTRYADDVTISGNHAASLRQFEVYFRTTIAKLTSPVLSINEEKVGLYRRGERRMVTGLVITPEGSVSLGRERKRLISSLLHRSSLDQLTADKLGLLKGLLGFAIANEPNFVGRMRAKYGNEIVEKVLKTRLPNLPNR